MTIDNYIEELLGANFNLRNGDPIPWYVLAAAYVAGKTSELIIERARKMVSMTINREINDEVFRKMLDLEPEELEPIILERVEHQKMSDK